MPKVVLPPSQLFQIQEWNRYNDWWKTIPSIGWMQFWSVNSLTAIDGHDPQYFNELRSTVVSR